MNEIRKLIAAAKGMVESHHDCYDENAQRVGVLIDDLDALRAAIPAAEAELAEMGWIPVSERLPEAGVCVVVALSDGDVSTGYKSQWSGLWHKEGTAAIVDVTHWQPLPTPPSEPEEKL